MRTPRRPLRLLRNPADPRLFALSSTERADLRRRLARLDALETRALEAYERGEHARAEALDAEYAELAEALEGLEGELLEGADVEAFEGDREPEESDLYHGRATPGRVAPPVALDLSAQLRDLYAEYLQSVDDARVGRTRASERMDPAYFAIDFADWPIRTREDALAYYARSLIEETVGEALPHVPPGAFVDAAEDAYERREDLRRRYREGRGLRPNAPAEIPRVERVFHELMDQLDTSPFDDFGTIELVADPRAADGGDRQFAYCATEDGAISIGFAPRAEHLPETNLRGLMAHELGHAIDFRYPRETIADRLDLHALPRGIERRADMIAEHTFGLPIQYDARDVQCVECRGVSPRPAHLRPNPLPRAVEQRHLIDLGTRGTVRFRDWRQPVHYDIARFGIEAYDVRAMVPVSAPRPPGLRLPARHRWPIIGTVSVEVRDYGRGRPVMAIYGSRVLSAFQGQGVGTNLYEIAADVACGLFRMDFASDTARSEYADRRWLALGAELEEVDVENVEDPEEALLYEETDDYFVLECDLGPFSTFPVPRSPGTRRRPRVPRRQPVR